MFAQARCQPHSMPLMSLLTPGPLKTTRSTRISVCIATLRMLSLTQIVGPIAIMIVILLDFPGIVDHPAISVAGSSSPCLELDFLTKCQIWTMTTLTTAWKYTLETTVLVYLEVNSCIVKYYVSPLACPHQSCK